MKHLRVRWMLVVTAATGSSAAQPMGDRPDGPRAPASLTEAAREGAVAFTTARLDRLADMATTDLAPLDDPPADAPPPDAPWPGGEPAAETAWASCGFAGGVPPVDLRAGPLLPVQVSVASRGARAVALVAMGRPGTDRHGMVFPESRWVEWSTAPGADPRVEVFSTRGFMPGAALALDDREATVLSYAPPDPRTPYERASRTPDVDVPARIAITRVDARGRWLLGPHELEGSNGWQIDSPVVLWRHGAAVVLGHPTGAPGDGGRREVLHFLDARGHDARAPLELTAEARDDGLGASPAGLAVAPDGASLAAGWMVPSGPIAGVWVRRGITLDAQPFVPNTTRIAEAPPRPGQRRPAQPMYPRGMWTFRVAQGEGFWGPTVTRGGVYFGRGDAITEGLPPVTEVLFSPWPVERHAAPSQVLDAWRDPLPTWSAGGVMVAGFAPRRGTDDRALVVAYAARGERALRTLTLPVEPGAVSARDAVDVAFAPLDSGALLAWIDAPSDDHARRLELARVACQRAPDVPARPRPQRPAAPAVTSGRTRRNR